MRKIKKLVIILLIIALIFSNFSYAEVPKITQTEAGEALSKFALNTVSNHSDDIENSLIQADIDKALNNEKVDEKYKLNTKAWITFAVNNSLGLNKNNYVTVTENYTNVNGCNGFEKVKDAGANKKLTVQELKNNLKQGDILISKNTGIYAICCGESENVVVYMSTDGLKQDELYKSDNDNETNIEWRAIIRITEETANGLVAGNVTTLLAEDRDDEEYSKYYGTAEGRYVGSYNFLSWLFNQFLGFMDYLFGIIAYILRAPFVGWANIIENMINDTINNLSGVQTTDVVETGGSASESVYTPSAMDAYISNRINIEDVIYNNVPILDINFFDVNLDKYKTDDTIVISDDSVIYKLRENIATWYVVIRNVSIIALLMVLIYLGIRLAISTTGEAKAEYKKMLIGWVTGFIIVFFIHYFMIIVIDINETLVDLCYNTMQNVESGVSLYDTIRTRAYSAKLSEGVPATIMYIFLIYFLIRFLVVYLKRYFTVNILALMGPIMGIKFAFDKIKSGKSKSSSFISWMFDFALNVFLQFVHAILYTFLMTLAFKFALTNIPGFVLALCLMNFIFKAEKIFMNIFKFDERSHTLGDVVDGFDPQKHHKSKNYMFEAYKVARGVSYYSMGLVHFGTGFVKNTTKLFLNDDEYEKLQEFKENAMYRDLGLGKLKKQNPELYEQARKLSIENNKLKGQVLKRNLKNGMAPIKAMAGLMASIPIMIGNPEQGVTMLTKGINNMADVSRSKPHYGYETKKQIRGRRGKVVAKILAGPAVIGYDTAKKGFNEMAKTGKKVSKNEAMIKDSKRAGVLVSDIEQQLKAMKEQNTTEDSEEKFEKSKAEAIKRTIQSVMSSKDIKHVVTSYMNKHGITTLSDADIDNILGELNLGNAESDIRSLTKEQNKLTQEVEQLKLQIKVNGVATPTEQTELKGKQDRIAELTKEIDIAHKVAEQIATSEELYVFKEEGSIKKTMEEYMKQSRKKVEDLKEEDVKKIVDMFNENIKENKVDKYTTAEEVKTQVATKKKKKKNGHEGLDKKETVDAMLEAIMQSGSTNVDDEFKDVSQKIRELQILNEKSKNARGKSVMNVSKFIKEIKGKEK